MTIKLFRYFYYNVDLSKAPDIVSEKSAVSIFSGYIRIFDGMKQQLYDCAFPDSLKNACKADPLTLFNTLRKKVFQRNILSRSSIILCLLKESANQKGKSIWGEG